MKAPAFQFYATDWLGSQRVAMLTLEEEGAYIRLVASCWQHGSIPSDPEQAARLIGKGASTTLATNVLTMFKPSTEPGRMIHDRLEHQRTEQEAWREKSAAGGRKSAEIRKGGGKGGSTVVKPPYQPNGNTPTPSPSPTPSPEVQEGNGASNLQTLRTRLCRLYSRSDTDRWSYEEEHALAQVSTREKCLEEFAVIECWRNSIPAEERKFFPQSLSKLVANWTEHLDKARSQKPVVVKRKDYDPRPPGNL